MLNTIAKYDDFTPKGKTGQRLNNNTSLYCSKVKVKETFEDLLSNSDFKDIFISYNNEGLLTLNEFEEICSKFGKYNVYKKEYKTFKADSKRNNKSTQVIECLHHIKK